MIAIAPRDLGLLLAITIVWGLNLIVSKIGVDAVPPIVFTTLRFMLLAVVLAPFLRIRRGHMGPLVVAALLGGGLHFALMFVGLSLARNVSSVAIASQLGVPFATLLSVALLGEVVRWRRWSGSLLAFAGVVVMGFDPQVTSRWASLAFIVASAFVGALGLIAVKKLVRFEPLELQAWFAWISWPLLLALAVPLEQPSWQMLRDIPAAGWLSILYATLAASLFAHTIFYYLVRRYPVTSVAPLTVLSPVWSVLFGVWVLDDRLTAQIVLGGICTLAGVLIITVRERRLPETAT
jgi:O-acetylserine/cysteine efflux transporter